MHPRAAAIAAFSKSVTMSSSSETNSAQQGAESLEEETLQHVAEVFPHIVWTATPEGDVDFISPQLGEYTGVEPDDSEFLDWTRYVHPDDLERVIGRWSDARERKQTYSAEQRLRSKRGGYKWFIARAEPIIGEDREVAKWCGTLTSIHEHKVAERKLKAASRQKDEFIAMLGHELRNPLAAIAASHLALSKEGLAEGDRLAALDILGRQINHLTRLVNDTVDVARLSFGKLRLDTRPLEMNQLVAEWAEGYRAVVEEGGYRLKVELEADEIWVDGDAVRLSQCINNLVGNAMKFAESGTEVVVRTTSGSSGDHAEIRVIDSGVGLDGEEVENLFKRFTQGRGAGVQDVGGLGLGLSVVREIMQMHDGAVEGSSRGKGRGATFTLKMPIGKKPQAEAEGGKKASAQQPSKRVLLVEDNTSVARSLELFLQLEGHSVELAADGEEAFEKLASDRFDLILSDLTLPGEISGWDVATRVKDNHADASQDQPYLVALSGHALPEHVEKSKAAGFQEHIAKPPSLDQLRAVLSRAADRE